MTSKKNVLIVIFFLIYPVHLCRSFYKTGMMHGKNETFDTERHLCNISMMTFYSAHNGIKSIR